MNLNYQSGYPQYQQPYQQTNPYQNRLQQLPQYNQPYNTVDNEAAAMNSPIDFSGNLQFFVDPQHGYIYTKQLNLNDCSVQFLKYKLEMEQPTSTQSTEYVSRSEFDQLCIAVNSIRSDLNVFTTDVRTNVIDAKPEPATIMESGAANGKRKNTRTTEANGQ